MLEPLFKDVAGVKACNFIKKRLQHRCFLVNIVKFLKLLFGKTSANDCFLTFSMVHCYMGLKACGLVSTPNSLVIFFLNLHISKFKRLIIATTEYKPTENPLWKIQVLGLAFRTLHYLMYLILTQFQSYIFNLVHRIRLKINDLKREELLFETNMKLCNMRFEKIKTWEGVSQS